jgi:DNA-directed RNA polymerase sigma subunit (sigma70/sigma32)
MNDEILSKRLDGIEHQLKFFADTYKHLHDIFIHGVHIKLEKSLLEPTLSALTTQMREFSALYQKVNDAVKNDSVLGTLAFMAKRLHEIDITIQGIKENGLKKKIQLDFTVDGYEMVKRKPLDIETNTITPEEALKKLVESLDEREGIVLMHRYGLFETHSKTLVATGKIIKVTPERVRAIQNKALRKCRMPSRKKLSMAITHHELKKDILGEDE